MGMRRTLSLLVLLLFAPLVQAADMAAPAFLEKAAGFDSLEKARLIDGLWQRLLFRAAEEPLLPIATAIFLCAILHTFFAAKILHLGEKLQEQHELRARQKALAEQRPVHEDDLVSFPGTVFHFLGEVEAVFGIWSVVLLAAMAGLHGLDAVRGYLAHGVTFTEPMFVVVIMALSSTRPVLAFAEACLGRVARLGKESPAAWWLTILIIAPLLGSFITEPGAMTIAAMLLIRKFYQLKPSPRFAYATLGLLFTNVSIGGTLTHFAAPPVLMVAKAWQLDTPTMFLLFGDKALPAVVLSTLCYFAWFRKELQQLANHSKDSNRDGVPDAIKHAAPVPVFVTLVHLAFLAWTVIFAHDPPLFIGGFLFFLAFSQATRGHQTKLDLRGPILVGFFLAGLIIHGGLQRWWLEPVLAGLTEWPMFLGSTFLTSFNDNAAITYLASQAAGLSPSLKYAVLAGAVTGGGLTVIANAPNPAGQALLGRFFDGGVSPLKLLLAALIPTLIAIACFMMLPGSKALPEGKPAAALQAHRPQSHAP